MKTLTITCMILAFLACSNDDSIVDNGSDGSANNESNILYRMPSEETTHEGTWLQWPHNYVYEGMPGILAGLVFGWITSKRSR